MLKEIATAIAATPIGIAVGATVVISVTIFLSWKIVSKPK
jgi:hypothetical protein